MKSKVKNGRGSRNKGKAGERELAAFLRELGVQARRGVQYDGLEGRDVVTDLDVHIECKRVERLQLWEAIRQAREDAKGLPWVVAHRPGRERWIAVVDLEQLVRWIRLATAPIVHLCVASDLHPYECDGEEGGCEHCCGKHPPETCWLCWDGDPSASPGPCATDAARAHWEGRNA